LGLGAVVNACEHGHIAHVWHMDIFMMFDDDV